MAFHLDKSFLSHPRLRFLTGLVPIEEHLENLEFFINECYSWEMDDHGREYYDVKQSGRVVALRATDETRRSSAFKSSIYLGKYKDMDNTDRFLKSMVSAGHSYEPIRGESILFLFLGVGKPVYDHLITYTIGRTSRIAGGQRANVPWGFELPSEVKNPDEYNEELDRIRNVIRLAKQDKTEQMQAARSKLPVGYIMPPFILEFSEEALIKHVFTQRLFERGAQGATVEIVKDMWDCCVQIDEEKWTTLFDYHGPHIEQWEKTMRTIRKENPTLVDLVPAEEVDSLGDLYRYICSTNLYDLLIEKYGKMPPSMWDKK